MEEMEKYATVATDTLKDAVKDSAKTVKKEIEATAPVDSGKYKKSWRAKATEETSTKLTMVVHSATRYQIAHLLEHGRQSPRPLPPSSPPFRPCSPRFGRQSKPPSLPSSMPLPRSLLMC